MPDKSKHATVTGMNQWFKVRRNGRSTEVVVDPRATAPRLAETVLTCVGVDHLANQVLEHPIAFPGGAEMLAPLAAKWALAYEADTLIPPRIGSHCSQCEFRAEPGSALHSGFHECWKRANNWTDADFAQGTVLDIWNFRGKGKLIEQGVVKLNQVSAEDLKLTDEDVLSLTDNHRRWMQVNGLPVGGCPEFCVNGG